MTSAPIKFGLDQFNIALHIVGIMFTAQVDNKIFAHEVVQNVAVNEQAHSGPAFHAPQPIDPIKELQELKEALENLDDVRDGVERLLPEDPDGIQDITPSDGPEPDLYEIEGSGAEDRVVEEPQTSEPPPGPAWPVEIGGPQVEADVAEIKETQRTQELEQSELSARQQDERTRQENQIATAREQMQDGHLEQFDKTAEQENTKLAARHEAETAELTSRHEAQMAELTARQELLELPPPPPPAPTL